MGLDLNTALISETFDGLIKTQDGNVLTASPLPIGDGRGNDSSLALATAGNGVIITGTLTVGGVNIGGDLATAQSDIIAIETKTDFITVTGAINLDTIKTKSDFITVTQAVDLDAIETKTDFITITQAVNLDTVESNAAAAKTKTDFLTVTQAVDLDTLESDMVVAKADITAIEAKTDYITISSALNLNTVASNASNAKAKTDFITITQAVNLDTIESDLSQAQTDINQIEGKTDKITVTQAVNLDTMESDIATNNAKNSYPSADATKVGYITVTQAVDLDSMETNISNLQSNKYDKTGGTISGNVIVTGDLTVQGTTSTTQTLSVENSFIELANQNTANVVDSGFYTNYSLDAGVTTKYAGLFKDAGDSDKFKLFKGLEVEPTTTVDTAGTGYTKGDLVVNDLDAVTISGVLSDGVTATTQSPNDNSTKVATTAYVDAQVTAEDLDFAGDSGTGAVDLDSQTFTIAGTANEIETSASGQTITVGLPSNVGITNSLGVGTSSPIENVQITDSSNVTLRLTNTTDSTASLVLQNTGSDNLFLEQVGGATLFKHGSTERMRISSSGNVGIGTSAPTEKLQVEGNAEINGIVYMNNGTVADDGRFRFGTGNDYSMGYDSSSDTLRIADGNTLTSNVRLAIDSSGNVGIGTSSPDNIGNYSILTIAGKSTSAGGRIHLQTSDNSNEFYMWNAVGVGTVLTTQQADDLLFGTNTVERMRIDASGRVGIGTASPSAKLQIIDNVAGWTASIENQGTGAGNSGLIITAGEDNGDNTLLLRKQNGTETFAVKGDGNVGIGTSGPDTRLTVGNGIKIFDSALTDSLTISASTSSSYANTITHGNVGLEFNNNTLTRGYTFSTNSVEKVRINQYGLTFNGDTAAANALDDYEEGTFTPVVSDATSGGNTASGSFSGKYTKIGNVVHVDVTLANVDTTGMTSGNDFIIQSLPFTRQNDGVSSRGVTVTDNVTFAGTLVASVNSNTSYVYFSESTSGTSDVGMKVSAITASGSSDIFFSITYLAA